ncbi:xanthine permease [Nakamurella multipartita DSM 44233]|uniref:Xanthine permease n=1 Tax=Nakamurella multipartita (strain ATCC 700099 / DSM 44233 / CIP 104796 / JCM 9543 / NBRC 105858 / Y-104) TaxID=479431 RepID=C8XK08_NAKMY|nr:2-oxo-4-hydroxy-4-carboxy-5-ureidoimidazoline decarboxylase [Nakamurella multipartita]ACV76691.1 xanthine permease [Nakamurella multipartita DSM 44233]
MASAPTASTPARTKSVKHPVDQVLPIPKLAVYGIQHVLAFYAGAVVVPILLASAIGLTTEELIHLINADLFTCGIASIIQSVGFWKIGVRLPLLQGVTFTAVSPMIAIAMAAGGGTEGLLYIYGAVIIAGLFTFFMAPYFARLIRFFPPVVTGTVITIIGIALLPVAALDAVGGGANPDPTSTKNLAYALGTLFVIVLIQRIFKGFLATVAVLAGLVIGTAVAFFLGDASFSSLSESAWFGVTTPFYFGIPKFSAAAIISMIVVMLITAVETTGDVFATGEIVEKRVGGEDVARALRADGLATFIGGVLNSFPYTCFAENVGLVRLTRVKSRYVVAAAGVFMILIGMIPKAGALVASIPPPVLGGAAIAMFATVAVVGIQTLSRVDFHDHRNVVIVGTSIGLAMFVTVQPDVAKAVPEWAQIIFGSGITLGSLTAIILNLVFHHLDKGYGPAVAGSPKGGVIRLEQVNNMSREEFVATFGRLFQGPSWVVERAYDHRPFADTPALRAAFQDALFTANSTEQRDLLSFYPDLGSDAGPDMSEESKKDRAAAGLMLLNDDDHEQFSHLTSAYRERFGIPLIMSVRDVEKRDQILKSGWERLQNSPTQEQATAVIEVAKIANHRFDDLVADASPLLLPRATFLEEVDNLSTPPSARQESVDEEFAAGTTRFNAMGQDEVRQVLASCLDVPRWIDAVAAGRPYPSAQHVLHTARVAASDFSDEELRAALAKHPRIGERAGAGHDVEFSQREQSAVGTADAAVQQAILAGNADYENKFDRVFLIRAAGRSAPEILAELQRRLGNSPEQERAEVVTQLREIALTRLETVLA